MLVCESSIVNQIFVFSSFFNFFSVFVIAYEQESKLYAFIVLSFEYFSEITFEMKMIIEKKNLNSATVIEFFRQNLMFLFFDADLRLLRRLSVVFA